MQDQLGREHIAFYSQYDPDSQQYTYSPHGLIFSDEAVARADGKSGLILYEIRDAENKHLNKVVLIHAPISRQAIDEMRIWARGSGSSPSQQSIRNSLMSNSVSGNPEQECDTNPELWECELDGIIVTLEEDWMGDPFFDHESISEEDDGGGLYPGTFPFSVPGLLLVRADNFWIFKVSFRGTPLKKTSSVLKVEQSEPVVNQ